jgi:glycosyltransferase involved in cell wall biosynthesis
MELPVTIPQVPDTDTRSQGQLPVEVSVVVPVFNEEAVLEQTWHRLSEVLQATDRSYELVFVDDGSHDNTATMLVALQDRDPNTALVLLSRNFGKELAMTAGLDYANGNAVIVIDADLQDPPEYIPEMLAEWQKGYDMVTMRRKRRTGESLAKRFSAWGFYRLLNRISDVEIPPDTGDFRLLSRRAVDALALLPERQRYMKGLFAWIGFRRKEIIFDRSSRAAGHSKWNYLRLWHLAVDGITAFSTAPLRMASHVGLWTAAGAFGYGIWIVIKTLLFGDPVAGFPTLMVTVLMLGGIQLLAIGVLGEYLGRLFLESKRRPLYLVQTHRPAPRYVSKIPEKSKTT